MDYLSEIQRKDNLAVDVVEVEIPYITNKLKRLGLYETTAQLLIKHSNPDIDYYKLWMI